MVERVLDELPESYPGPGRVWGKGTALRVATSGTPLNMMSARLLAGSENRKVYNAAERGKGGGEEGVSLNPCWR